MSEPQLNTAAALTLLCALRAAGARVYVHAEGDLLVSPPARQVVWPGNPERAIDDLLLGIARARNR